MVALFYLHIVMKANKREIVVTESENQMLDFLSEAAASSVPFEVSDNDDHLLHRMKVVISEEDRKMLDLLTDAYAKAIE